MTFKNKLKAYLNLTRAHFAIVWPLLFISGLLISFREDNYFSLPLLIRYRRAIVALIGVKKTLATLFSDTYYGKTEKYWQLKN